MSGFDLNKFKTGYGIGPVYSWVWNSEINESVITSQLEEMAEANIKAFYIIPEPKEFRPGTMDTYLEPDFLSCHFFEMIKFAKSESKRLGMKMWLYDEGGWPSGRACGQIVNRYPSYRARKISEKIIALKQNECFDEQVLAVFNRNFVQVKCPYTAAKDEELYVYYIDMVDSQLIDILNDSTVDEYIDTVYNQYKYALGNDFAGDTIAIFTDEAILLWPFYTDNVSKFEKETGLCFNDNIPALFDRKNDDASRKFRVAYIDFCSKEAEKSYMFKIHEWCLKNGIMFTGHMDGDHKISDYKKQIGSALRHLRNMDIPGVDSISRQIFPGNNTFFPRIASSAAHQTGKKYSLSETFSVYGDGLTYDEMRFVCNAQFIRGINIINVMNIPSGRDRFLSSQMRPCFAPNKLNWYGLKEFNKYLSRMMYLCSVGNICVDVALYMPIRDMWAGNDVQSEYISLGEKLEDSGFYFDIIDDDFLENCELKDNTLTMDDAEYSVVYITKTEYISKASVEKLTKFAKNGGKILYSADENISGYGTGIRFMKRTSENSIIYFWFNESCEVQTIKPKLEPDLNYYSLSCETGSATLHSKEEICLQSGECLILVGGNFNIIGEKKITSKKFVKTLDTFEQSIYKTSFLSDGEYKLVDGSAGVDGGRIIRYRTDLKLENISDLILEMNGVPYCAIVKFNGVSIANLIFSPFECRIDSELVRRDNTLEIFVVDNPAKALICADYSNLKKGMAGWYHDTTLNYEKEKETEYKLKINIYSAN